MKSRYVVHVPYLGFHCMLKVLSQHYHLGNLAPLVDQQERESQKPESAMVS